ncbi:MAG TPA: hypothetical protein VGP57_20575, partial [Actinoplanes sp.]|nr:hypothetical protein [Actinoplanes sp.]
MKRSIAVLAVTVLFGVLLRPAAAQAQSADPAGPPVTLATSVCSVYCDTRDPSLARQDTFPVGDKTQNGRRISLHLSDADAMAWGSIDNGA